MLTKEFIPFVFEKYNTNDISFIDKSIVEISILDCLESEDLTLQDVVGLLSPAWSNFGKKEFLEYYFNVIKNYTRVKQYVSKPLLFSNSVFFIKDNVLLLPLNDQDFFKVNLSDSIIETFLKIKKTKFIECNDDDEIKDKNALLHQSLHISYYSELFDVLSDDSTLAKEFFTCFSKMFTTAYELSEFTKEIEPHSFFIIIENEELSIKTKFSKVIITPDFLKEILNSNFNKKFLLDFKYLSEMKVLPQAVVEEEQGTTVEPQIAEEEQGTTVEPQATAEEEQGTTVEPQATAEEEQGTTVEPQATAEEEQSTTVEPQATAEEEQGTTVEPQVYLDSEVIDIYNLPFKMEIEYFSNPKLINACKTALKRATDISTKGVK
jgi:hypothetical protein